MNRKSRREMARNARRREHIESQIKKYGKRAYLSMLWRCDPKQRRLSIILA